MTVSHFVAHMPQVYVIPMMILHMEMASGSAISPHLPEGFVSVGMDVQVRHLAATPVGRTVLAISRVIKISCAYRKSNPVILMVQSAQDWTADNASGCLGGA
jgi:predicted thioesterase